MDWLPGKPRDSPNVPGPELAGKVSVWYRVFKIEIGPLI